MRAVLADSGPLYALVDPDDQYHTRAVAEAGRLADLGMATYVAFPTAMEAYTLVLKRLGPRVAHRWFEDLTLGAALVTPTEADFRRAAQRAQAFADQDISLFDALLAVLAKTLDLPIWTFDHHFDVMGCRVWRE